MKTTRPTTIARIVRRRAGFRAAVGMSGSIVSGAGDGKRPQVGDRPANDTMPRTCLFLMGFSGHCGVTPGKRRRRPAAELGALSHVERTQRMVALGQAARDDGATRELLGELWRTEGDAGPYARRLVLKSCYGSRDGARVLQALSDPSRLLRAGARKLVALCCDDTQATGALQTTWYVRQHLPLLSRLWAAGRFGTDRCVPRLAGTAAGDTRLADCVPYGSPPAIERHLAAALRRPSVVFGKGCSVGRRRSWCSTCWLRSRPGKAKPEAPLCWVVERSLPRLCVREPLAALSVIDAYLARGQAVPGSVWGPLSRRQPAQAIAVAARHRVPCRGACSSRQRASSPANRSPPCCATTALHLVIRRPGSASCRPRARPRCSWPGAKT